MKKIYCECCGQELKDIPEYSYPTLDIDWYEESKFVSILSNDICEECLYNLTKIFEKYKKSLCK